MAKPKTPAAPAAETAAPAAEAAPAVVKITKNGVTRPKDESKGTGRVWTIADAISAKLGAPADRKSVIDQVHAEGINTSTGATQYGKWRKFHGLVGEASPGRAAKAEAAPASPPAPPAPPAPSAPVEEAA